MASDKAQVDVLQRMLKPFDVANARPSRAKGIHEIRVARIRIVELHRERLPIRTDLAHESQRPRDRNVARGITDNPHDRAGPEEARAKLAGRSHLQETAVEYPDAVAQLVGLGKVVRRQEDRAAFRAKALHELGTVRVPPGRGRRWALQEDDAGRGEHRARDCERLAPPLRKSSDRLVAAIPSSSSGGAADLRIDRAGSRS